MTRSASCTLGAGAAAVLLAGLAATGRAQDDEAAQALRGRLEALVQRDPSGYLCCDWDLAVGPLGAIHGTADIWTRDRRHYRVEDTQGSVIVVTPEAATLYSRPLAEMLHSPGQALAHLEPTDQARLALMGLGSPEAVLGAVRSVTAELTPAGECTVGTSKCVVLAGGPKAKEIAQQTISLFCSGSWQADVTMLHLFFDRQSALPRGMHLEATMTSAGGGFVVGLTVDIRVREVEPDVDVPDDMLTFSPPKDTTVVECSQETPVDDVSEFLSRMVSATLFGTMKAGKAAE